MHDPKISVDLISDCDELLHKWARQYDINNAILVEAGGWEDREQTPERL
jgi:hypothetical protein